MMMTMTMTLKMTMAIKMTMTMAMKRNVVQCIIEICPRRTNNMRILHSKTELMYNIAHCRRDLTKNKKKFQQNVSQRFL